MKKSFKLTLGRDGVAYYSEMNKPVISTASVQKYLGRLPRCVNLHLSSAPRRGFYRAKVFQTESKHYPHFVQSVNGSGLAQPLFSVMEITVAHLKRWPAYRNARGLLFWSLQTC